MLEFGACPRCHQDVSEERRKSKVVVCNNCGFVSSDSEIEFREKMDNRFIKIALGLSVLIVGGFIQLCSWDLHMFEVVPLQVKELIGSASNQDLERFAEICMDRKKYDCVEREYTRLADRDLTLAPRLGQFQMSRGHYAEAVNTYRGYFSKGGVDLEASYQMARALGQVGMIDEAAKYYDYVLGAKPDVVQVTVVQNYVRMLMEANRLDRAKQLIEDVRHKSETSSYFMDDELKKISAKL